MSQVISVVLSRSTRISISKEQRIWSHLLSGFSTWQWQPADPFWGMMLRRAGRVGSAVGIGYSGLCQDSALLCVQRMCHDKHTWGAVPQASYPPARAPGTYPYGKGLPMQAAVKGDRCWALRSEAGRKGGPSSGNLLELNSIPFILKAWWLVMLSRKPRGHLEQDTREVFEEVRNYLGERRDKDQAD